MSVVKPHPFTPGGGRAELPRWAKKVWYPDICTKLELGVTCEEKKQSNEIDCCVDFASHGNTPVVDTIWRFSAVATSFHCYLKQFRFHK